MTILLIVVGSSVIYKDNIAVITGKTTVGYTAGDTGYSISELLNYPSGFNRDNCIVLAFGTRRSGTSDYGYSYGNLSDKGYSGANLVTAIGKAVTLKNSDINITMHYNFFEDGSATSNSSSFDIDYKIVLIKI